MKNARDYLIERIKSEKPAFVRVLKAVPDSGLDYRPHPKSTSTGDLVWLLVCELADAVELIQAGQVEYRPREAPARMAAIIAEYEKHCAALEAKLSGVSDNAWDGPAKFLVEGKVAWETTLGDMLWGVHLDAIHHRGQLSSYLRPMGAKVPSIYGPSGDDPGT